MTIREQTNQSLIVMLGSDVQTVTLIYDDLIFENRNRALNRHRRCRPTLTRALILQSHAR